LCWQWALRPLAQLSSACFSVRNPANILHDERLESRSAESLSEREAPYHLVESELEQGLRGCWKARSDPAVLD